MYVCNWILPWDIYPVDELTYRGDVHNQLPRLSIFYGDTENVTKEEVTYDKWKY